MQKGVIYKILQDVYKVRCSGAMVEVRQRIIRMQISLKTGLNLNEYTQESMDTDEEIQRVLNVIKGSGIGLEHYEYKKEGSV